MNNPLVVDSLGARPRSLAACCAALALLIAMWPASAAAGTRPISHKETANWAGYAVTAASPLQSVSGQWTAPSATCQTPFATYSAFWVGLGGFTGASHSLEQIGTETNCTGPGQSKTYAWYELLPAPPVKLKLSVKAGDTLSASVSVHGQRVSLHIQDLTTGRRSTKTATRADPDTSSAEWIAEAPSGCSPAGQCWPLPLADFGTVRYTHARARTDDGQSATITNPAFHTPQLTLAFGAQQLGPGLVRISGDAGQAKPSATSHDGGTFTVTYEQTAPPKPPLPFGGQDRLRHAPFQEKNAASGPTVGGAW